MVEMMSSSRRADVQTKCNAEVGRGMSRDTGCFLVPPEGVATMKYIQLTREERYLMSVALSTGTSLRAVALKPGRHVSTISREGQRNAENRTGCYRSDMTHSYVRARPRRCR